MHETFFEAKLILFISTALILLLCFVIVAALLIEQKRKFRHKQQLADIQNQYEKALLQTELKIQEDTFKAISQNLHDNVGSNISTAMLLLYKDDEMPPDEIECNRKDALGIMDKVVDDLKEIARSLNPDYLHEIGLSEAILNRVQQLEQTKRYHIRFWVNESPKKLDQKKQLILFYIFQEAVNNIITHAKATAIDIALDYDAAELSLVIKDDGTGLQQINGEKTVHRKGSGLINMKQHARLIGADLDMKTAAGQGTAITVKLPEPYAQA